MKSSNLVIPVLAASLLLAASGCTSYKAGSVQVRDVAQYGNNAREGEIVGAAEALVTAAAIEPVFYVNLAEHDYYPVQIVVQNNSASRVLMLKDKVELTDANGNAYRPINVATMIDEFEHNKMAYALLGFGIFSYMSADDANKKMAADWREKELPAEVIVNPSRKSAGFVYLKMPRGVKPSGMTLTFNLENLETKADTKFQLHL